MALGTMYDLSYVALKSDSFLGFIAPARAHTVTGAFVAGPPPPAFLFL